MSFTASCSLNISNTLVINKYVLMGRQLRNFNDAGSIMKWANAMILVKGLLLEPKPASHASANFQPPSPSFLPSQYRLSTTNQHISTTKITRSTHSTCSITPPISLSFKPATKKPLTQSPPRCSTYVPRKPSSLTTYTLCLPTISPADSLPQCPKRRKLSVSPSVDYWEPLELPQPTSTTTTIRSKVIPGQGKHIWPSHDHGSPDAHQWRKKMYEGADEYKVVKAPPDFNIRLKLMNVATGKYFKMKFTKEKVKFLFET